MASKHWAWIVPMVAFVAGVLLRRSCNSPDLDPSAPFIAREDSLRAAYSKDSLRLVGLWSEASRKSDSLSKVATLSLYSASRYRRIADSLRALDRYAPPDSDLTPCDSALVLTIRELDTLRVGYDSLVVANGNLRTAYRGSAEAEEAAQTGWVLADGNLNKERAVWAEERSAWRATVKKLRPCTILGLIGCPEIGIGVAAVYANGRVGVGPAVAVTIPLRF